MNLISWERTRTNPTQEGYCNDSWQEATTLAIITIAISSTMTLTLTLILFPDSHTIVFAVQIQKTETTFEIQYCLG